MKLKKKSSSGVLRMSEASLNALWHQEKKYLKG
jgi:hypothetical protein